MVLLSELQEPTRLAKHVADLKGLLAALSIQRATFAGLSLGGMIAMELAASNPDMVAGLALLDTTAMFPQATRDLLFELASSASFNGMPAITDKFMQLSFSPHFMATNPKITATIRKGMLASDAASIAAAARMVAKIDLRQRLSAIQCPTLVIVGEQDQLTPPPLAEAVGGCNQRSTIACYSREWACLTSRAATSRDSAASTTGTGLNMKRSTLW